MSFLPFEKLHYAETHFKFKLPWSLLYRRWPEIIADAPFQFVPGSVPTIWLAIRDAHKFPVSIEKVELEIYSDDKNFSQKIDVDFQKKVNEQFAFYSLKLGEIPAGKYSLICKIFATKIDKKNGKKLGKVKCFNRWSYPFLKCAPLKIHILSESLPKPEYFVSGEMHCHTNYSADHVEHGAAPFVLQQAACAIGLDFVSCTDHAYDFAYEKSDYTKECSAPYTRFLDLQKEVETLNKNCQKSTQLHKKCPLIIASEEVSVGNAKGENVHMTVLGPKDYLPGLGDCGRNWLENRPTHKIQEILQQTKAHCFAAHPLQQMGAIEKFIFRRGYWSEIDFKLNRKIRGIQFWNGMRDSGFYLGLELWVKLLGQTDFSKEKPLLPIGGNDAHGDLNDTTAVNFPLISLKRTREHIFGKVRTVIKLPKHVTINEQITQEILNEAFNGDNCYVTDGPALWWERISANKLTFFARNTKDFGDGFRYIKIYGRRYLLNGKMQKEETLHIASQVCARKETDITIDFENYAYLRAECETATGKFALTSAASFVC